MCVASQVSPAGARAAGKHGLGLLSIGATTTGGFNALALNWKICSDRATEFGHVAQRPAWRLVGPMHIAETKAKARDNVRFGLQLWLRYFQEVAALPLAPAGSVDNAVDALIASGLAVVGDPDDAIAQLERLETQSGGFGCFLHLAHNWADWNETKRSYELFARYVMPRFQQLNVNREASMQWATENRPTFIGAMGNAINAEIQKHVAEQKEKAERAAG
jgi:limonene 1,2-monooxygenase